MAIKDFVYSINQFFPADPVRLVSQTGHTNNQTAGRLEIFISNQWGTVCSDSFDNSDAIVACRQLELSSVASSIGNAGNLRYVKVLSTLEQGDDVCSVLHNLRVLLE